MRALFLHVGASRVPAALVAALCGGGAAARGSVPPFPPSSACSLSMYPLSSASALTAVLTAARVGGGRTSVGGMTAVRLGGGRGGSRGGARRAPTPRCVPAAAAPPLPPTRQRGGAGLSLSRAAVWGSAALARPPLNRPPPLGTRAPSAMGRGRPHPVRTPLFPSLAAVWRRLEGLPPMT